MSVYKPYCKSEDTKSFAETIFDSIRYQEEDYLFKESDLQDLLSYLSGKGSFHYL